MGDAPTSASIETTPKPSTDNDDTTSAKSTSPADSAGTKRKRAPEPKFYAVRVGKSPGIYHSWNECLQQVRGFKNATFKAFPTLTDAERFMVGEQSSNAEPYKFYAVKSGRTPGIYTDWPSAQKQIIGWQKPRHKCFSTRAEAQRFLDSGDQKTGGNEEFALGVVYHASDGTEMPTTTPAPKKGKKNPPGPNGSNKAAKPPSESYSEADQEPGIGPLPPGVEDGFDPNIVLDPQTGEVVYKSEDQRRQTKVQARGLSKQGMLRIHTDGSSLRNGMTGAFAGVGVYFGPSDERNVSETLPGPRQTNQRAELTAIVRALDIAPMDRDVTIITDSRYAIDCVTSWYINWRKNGWKTAAGKSVENKDIVENVLAKIEERKALKVQTLFEWIKGHAQNPGNVEADKLAVNGARNGAGLTT